HRHHLGFETARAELVAQALDEDLGAAPGEGNLRAADDDAPRLSVSRPAVDQAFSASVRRGEARSIASSRSVSSRTCFARRASLSASSWSSGALGAVCAFCCSSSGRTSHLPKSL